MARKPRFQVKKLKGKRTRTVHIPKMGEDVNGKIIPLGGFDVKTSEEPAGWEVYFPSGSSMYVHTQAEMERLGFDKPAEIVDTDTGDVVGIDHDYEAVSQQKSSRSHRGPAANL